MRRIIKLLGFVGMIAAGWMAFVVVAMRTQSSSLLGVVRRFNREFTNKLQMRSAGTPGAYASLIRHTGRTSGRAYETPVVPFATDDGFVIVLPYGPATDWLANVRARGSAELLTGGKTYEVDRPEIIGLETVQDVFPPSEQRTHRIFGARQAVRFRRVDHADATTST